MTHPEAGRVQMRGITIERFEDGKPGVSTESEAQHNKAAVRAEFEIWSTGDAAEPHDQPR